MATDHKDDIPLDQLYAQVDKKKKGNKCASRVIVDLPTLTPAADSSVDQLYAQVHKNKKLQVATDPEGADQLNSQVDQKKRKKKGTTASGATTKLDTDTPVDQLYAQVDKKKKRSANQVATDSSLPDSAISKESQKKEMCKDSPQESGAVYSVVNKPKPPQPPPKSDLLMEELDAQ